MLPDGEAEIFNDLSWDEFSQQLFPIEGSAIEFNPQKWSCDRYVDQLRSRC